MPDKLNRKAFKQKLLQLINGFSADYRSIAEDVSIYVIDNIDNVQDVQKLINQAWSKFKVDDFLKDSITNDIAISACYGYGILPEVVVSLDPIKKSLSKNVWSADKLNLSQKLHGTSLEMKNSVVDTISTAIRKKKSWVQLARDLYDGYGSESITNSDKIASYISNMVNSARHMSIYDDKTIKDYLKTIRKVENIKTPGMKAAYKELLDKTVSASDKAVEGAVQTAVEEKSRYIAERLARTEYAHSYGEGFATRVSNDPDVIGVRSVLSGAHGIYDICDFFAEADLFGMGPGAYPKDQRPDYPYHPHCLCDLVEVYASETDHQGIFDHSSGEEFLNNLSTKDKTSLLGVEGRKAFENGGDWQDILKNYSGMSRINPVLKGGMFEE